ncbi:S41 family peptidase [Microcoleus sp. FACHB-SPT15]|uniref:S41 family peptidase n=1 Tax=Microcoleus sp. FACHB-SPT15 TaxID=2692830 RepID=UPI00177BAEE6|nr:S41 family peptidase [Microcoleus sp. FACHB-SPT15]MBD1803958.1 S41 family peptidase [Microcoleus sp. FACHB-SPT15]
MKSRTCTVLAAAVTLVFGTDTLARAHTPAPILNSSASSKSYVVSSQPASPLQQLVHEAWQVIETNYADPTFNGLNWQQVRSEVLSRRYTTKEEVYTAIRAMLSRLDNPATRFLTPEQFAGFESEDSGQLHVGVGLPELLSIDINEPTRQLTIVTPLPNTPASEAGLMSGDRVVAIDGVSTDGMDLGDATMRLRGRQGSTVTLTIQRNNSTFEVVLTRKPIAPASPAVQTKIEPMLGGLVGYIILRQFTESSPQEIREALERLEGADGFVLDLRNNPGGVLPALEEIAGLFLGENTIGTLQERAGTTKLRSTGTQLTDKPLVVLVNEGTGSAAELLAGALQDSGRAVVVGTPTFGKGLVHGFFPIADGAVVVVTMGQLKTPRGREILDVGITPDVRVDMAKSPLLDSTIALASRSDVQYRQAIEQLIGRTSRGFQVGNLPHLWNSLPQR